MSEPGQILEGLETIANELWLVAAIWHVLAAAALVAVLQGRRPSRRLVAGLLLLPLSSVAVAALTYAKPFNGLMFVVLVLALGGIGLRLPALPPEPAPRWCKLAGIAMTTFGLVYPHFTRTSSPLGHLYATPTGLVPCPTLSLVVGVALLADGLGSRAFALVLAGAGLFYGIFGVHAPRRGARRGTGRGRWTSADPRTHEHEDIRSRAGDTADKHQRQNKGACDA